MRSQNATIKSILSLLTLLWIACLWAGRKGGGGDLGVIYSSVFAAWNEQLPWVYLTHSDGPFFYHPFALVVFGFFSLCERFSQAIVASLLLHSISYWGFWYCSYKIFPELFQKGALWKWLFPFAIAIAPMHLDFIGQNVQLPVAFFLIVAQTLSVSKKPAYRFIAGFLSGSLGLMKLFTLFVTAHYYLKKDAPLRMGVLYGVGFGTLAPLLFFGYANGMYFYKKFFETLTVYHQRNLLYDNPGVLNLPSLIAKWGAFFSLGAWTSVLQFLIPALVGIFFFLWVWKTRENTTVKFQNYSWALAVGLMSFVNSSSRQDYFVFFVPAFAALSVVPMAKRVSFYLMLVGLLLIAFTQQAMVGRYLNVLLEIWRVQVLGMAAACAGLFILLYRQRDNSCA